MCYIRITKHTSCMNAFDRLRLSASMVCDDLESYSYVIPSLVHVQKLACVQHMAVEQV